MVKDIVAYTHGGFWRAVHKYVHWIEAARFSTWDIKNIDIDHVDFVAEYHNEQALRDTMDMAKKYMYFREGWADFWIRYPELHRLYGGLALELTGSATVVSNYSRLHLKKNLFWLSLSEFGVHYAL